MIYKVKILVNLKGNEGIFQKGRVFEGTLDEFPLSIQEEIKEETGTVAIISVKTPPEPEKCENEPDIEPDNVEKEIQSLSKEQPKNSVPLKKESKPKLKRRTKLKK